MIASGYSHVIDLEQSSECQIVEHPTSIPIPVQNLYGYIKKNCRFSSPFQFIQIFNKLRIPAKLNFSVQRCIYELALAIFTILIEKKEESVCLAAILLYNFLQRQKDSYWYILHYLVNLKEAIEMRPEEIYNQIPVPTIIEGSNLQHRYHCHCESSSKLNPCIKQQEEVVNVTDVAEQNERCPQCQQQFHPHCQTQGLVCNRCYLKNADTEIRSIKSLSCSYLYNCDYLTYMCFRCPDGLEAKQENSSSYMLSLKIYLNCQQIPEGYDFSKHYTLYLNQQPLNKVVKKTRLGLINIQIPVKYLEEVNIVVIQKVEKELSRPLSHQKMLERPFMFGIYQVVNKAIKKQVIRNNVNTVQLQPMKKLYGFLNKRHHQVKKVIIQMRGVQTPQYLPVRSLECSHFECFNYYELMQTPLPKTGRACPFCHKIINTLYVDPVIQQSLLSRGSRKKAAGKQQIMGQAAGKQTMVGQVVGKQKMSSEQDRDEDCREHIQIQFGGDYNVINIWPLDRRNEIVLD